MISGNYDITVPVDIVEMTGGERIVYFYLNGNKCTAKIPLDYKFDTTITLHISTEDMYFFNGDSGEVI